MAKTHSANEEIVREESASKEDEYPRDVLASKIRRNLKSLGPPLSCECCIYMVPKKFRRLIEAAAYSPQVVSIGPLHHGKKTLKKMEKDKLRYLDKFLTRAAKSLEYFLNTVRSSESRIRSCYAETFDHLNSDKFVKMILVDAGFIIELFITVYPGLRDKNDSILYKAWLASDIYQDLYLLENQLPFFALEELYDLAFPSRQNNMPSFLELACSYFSYYNNQNKSIQEEVRHFTDLLRSFQLPHSGRPEIHDEFKQNDKSIPQTNSILNCGGQNDRNYHFYSATELHEAGVKFKVSESKCLLDIKFSNGELTIPCLKLYDNTEPFIRNLMALEQCHYPDKTYICNYISVMDHLINTDNDVNLLVRKKIIVHWLGNQEPVATMFNKLCTHIIRTNDDWYTRLSYDMNAYYNVRRHRWEAILRHEYFSTPWRIASIIAAVILLVLTLIQTTCSIISL